MLLLLQLTEKLPDLLSKLDGNRETEPLLWRLALAH